MKDVVDSGLAAGFDWSRHAVKLVLAGEVFSEVGLEQPAISDWVTGKFVLETVTDEDQNTRLRVTVELAPDRSGDADLVADSICAQLLRLNSEYAHYAPADYQLPRVMLRPAGDPEYFPVGVKHRYTR